MSELEFYEFALIFQWVNDQLSTDPNIAGKIIPEFWEGITENDERVGFHPSLRNLAINNEEIVFFDSFPPLIRYDENELVDFMINFSTNPFVRIIRPFLRKKLIIAQDAWYQPSMNLIDLIGSACRLHPEYSQEFLKWGKNFASTYMVQSKIIVDNYLNSPPQLPLYWIILKKFLKK